MKKYIVYLLLFIAMMFFVAGITIQQQKSDLFTPQIIPGRIILTIEKDPYSSRTVTWRTNSNVTDGFAQLAKAEDAPEEIDSVMTIKAENKLYKSDNHISMYHTARLEGLLPGEKYIYRVGSGKNRSEWFQFSVPAVRDSTLSFIYLGDIQDSILQHGSRIIRSAYSHCPDAGFILFTGDMVDNPEDNDWGEWFQSGDWIYSSLPVVAAPGNHEYHRNLTGNFGTQWHTMFHFPVNGPQSLTDRVYYFDFNILRLVVLDTESFQKDESSMKAQLEWLDKVLSVKPKKWTVIAMHHPVYSSKSGRNNEKLRNVLKPLFDKYNVDLVLQGHDHSYARTGFMGSGKGSQGPVYVVSVAGAKMYDLNFNPKIVRMGSCLQLYQIVEITGNQLKFKTFTATGVLYDEFIVDKNDPDTKILRDNIPENTPEKLKLPALFVNRYSEKEKASYSLKIRQRSLADYHADLNPVKAE